MFTSLANTINYRKYLSKNSKTMSIFTRMRIFYQIIVGIQFLRDYKIVYNGLCP